MKPIGTIQDLIEEAKARTVWWALCIFAISYFLSHTSKSMWMNIPISVLLVSMLRILLNEVDFHWKVPSVRPQTYLSHLEKKQLSVNDSRLSSALPQAKWKRKIDSPVVEAAMKDFIDKILKDFVVDLWYSDITSDKEFPEQIRAIIMDVLGEISGRVKEINLVDLLTRDIVDLIGDHIDLFRRNEAAIGVDVMGIFSSDERDERLKHYLIASKELHPALISPESEYKVLQQLVSGLLAIVLRPREAQSLVVRSIARELVTCLVVQPIMDLVNPVYVNELIEYVLLAFKDDGTKELGGYLSTNATGHQRDHSLAGGIVQTGDSTSRKYLSSNNKHTDMTLAEIGNQKETTNSLGFNKFQEDPMQPRAADWARVLEAATQRRTEVLTPENLENMWTKGRHYKKKERKKLKAGIQEPISEGALPTRNLGKEMLISRTGSSMGTEEKAMMRPTPRLNLDHQLRNRGDNRIQFSQNPDKQSSFEGGNLVDESVDNSNVAANGMKSCLKRSNSASALRVEPDMRKPFTEGRGTIISEFYSPKFGRPREGYSGTNTSDVVIRSEGPHVPKLKCRVMGAYFENLGSNSFAVYSIAVTDVENRTWFVKRRYRNFERLHRHLKDIPNYTLHLPPKRIFSPSTEDAFVHQRCIQLDKYLQDLLSIANVAEQHEVWDFLSVSSKNYSFGKSSSVMRTLAVNVDDAVDDIVRQFKGVSDGLMRKVVGSSSHAFEASQISSRNLSWNADELNKLGSCQNLVETANNFSDNEEGSKDGGLGHEEVGSSTRASEWHSDNELNSKGFPPRVIKREAFRKLDPKKKHDLEVKSGLIGKSGVPAISAPVSYCNLEDPIGMPPEWTPPNVSVPLLNLVDKVFQLKRRGWLRRQVFWISKQILQLIMEDAIDDWLLRQIHWLRREDNIAQGIRWVQDILWPDGKFFIRIGNFQSNVDDTQSNQKSSRATSQQDGIKPGSFELQLEAARRASDVKKILFDGAPTALVSLIGHNQYKRCAKDIYYFTQSTICLKQLTYGILELLLISVFPELRDLVLDLHEKTEFPKTLLRS